MKEVFSFTGTHKMQYTVICDGQTTKIRGLGRKKNHRMEYLTTNITKENFKLSIKKKKC